MLELALREIEVLQSLKHKNVIKIIESGTNGFVRKTADKKIKQLIYIVLEYVECGSLLDLCLECKHFDEDIARYFMS